MSIINQLDAGRRAFVADYGQRGSEPLFWTSTQVRMSPQAHHRLTLALVEADQQETERTGRVSSQLWLSGPTHMWGMPIVIDAAQPDRFVTFSYDGVTLDVALTD